MPLAPDAALDPGPWSLRLLAASCVRSQSLSLAAKREMRLACEGTEAIPVQLRCFDVHSQLRRRGWQHVGWRSKAHMVICHADAA